jgi:S-formylglutathione hydrolase FrmB
MKLLIKQFITCLFCSCLINAALAQHEGKIIEEKTLNSTILSKDVKYAVYLPPDYTTSERSYPVVYLLHGYTDDHTGWVQFGEIQHYADKGISEGVIPPMIIVMPNADSSWYINSYDGKENYEDFFIKEFIPSIEKLYRIKSKKNYRGIAGLSMGGYGSLIYSIKYPELFVAAAPLSAGIFADDEITAMTDDAWKEISFPQLFGENLKGKARLNKAWYNNSVLKLVETRSADKLNKVRYWIDCGDDDFLTKGNCLLHIALTEKKVPHEFRVRNGAHSWSYWRSGITDALQFIGQSFHQQ